MEINIIHGQILYFLHWARQCKKACVSHNLQMSHVPKHQLSLKFSYHFLSSAYGACNIQLTAKYVSENAHFLPEEKA